MNTLSYIRAGNLVLGNVFPGTVSRLARRMLMTPRRRPLKDWERGFLATGEHFFLKSGLSAYRWGQGPRVLCMHGWEGRPTQFQHMIEALAGAGHEVIALDAPAHGYSPEKEANPLTFMAAILSAGEELGPFEMAIGHSMGASALALAIDRGFKVNRVVLVAGPSALRNVLNRFCSFFKLPARARNRFISLVASYTNAPMDTVDIRNLAPAFTIPALVIHDRDDPVVPFTDAGDIVKHWPDSQLLVTSGLGHSALLRDANVVNTVSRFAHQPKKLRMAA